MFDFIKDKGKISIELLVYKSMQIAVYASCFFVFLTWLCSIKNVIFIKIVATTFFLSMAPLGLWLALGTIYRWQTFKKTYKRFDLERSLGGLGSIIYVVFGFIIFIFSFYITFRIINNDYIK
jgi:hypothetical protein